MVTTSTAPQDKFQRPPVRMSWIAERVGGLVKNGVAGHEPENNGAFGVQQLRHGDARRVAREQGLAAARRHPQADIRHTRRKARGADRDVWGKRLVVLEKGRFEMPLPGAHPSNSGERNPAAIRARAFGSL